MQLRTTSTTCVFGALTVLTATWVGPAALGQNLILNGGNELPLVAGNIQYWTEVMGTGWIQRSVSPLPAAGSAYFFAGAVAVGELAQSVDVSGYAASIDAGTQVFSFSGYVASFAQNPSDLSRIVIEYRNDGGTVLDTFDSGDIASPDVWIAVNDQRTAKPGTRIVRVRLIATRKNGNNNDGYFDALCLTAIVPGHCAPDCDLDGTLSIDDFICFQTEFALGLGTADCDCDGGHSIDDFICFQTLFALGC